MKWTKRLKWLRASKIIIPIALAISLVFAGFTVYAHEAEYFVLRINNENDVNLALTMNRDLSEQTSRLNVPVLGRYEDVTPLQEGYDTFEGTAYKPDRYATYLPDDIAKYDGVHNVYEAKNLIAFYSFSFWLVNNSSRAVDVDMRLNIDSVVTNKNHSGMSIDEAVRVMVIDGDAPLLSEPHSYVVYKKAEKDEEAEKTLASYAKYDNVVNFLSDTCVMERNGIYTNIGRGETLRFTIVLWLEGWDDQCKDEIMGDSLKMSIDFSGR